MSSCALDAAGTLVVGVDVYEDFVQDLQRRLHHVQPYASMNKVDKRSLHLAISDKDGTLADVTSAARMHTVCCRARYDHGGWCPYERLERQLKADHLWHAQTKASNLLNALHTCACAQMAECAVTRVHVLAFCVYVAELLACGWVWCLQSRGYCHPPTQNRR